MFEMQKSFIFIRFNIERQNEKKRKLNQKALAKRMTTENLEAGTRTGLLQT